MFGVTCLLFGCFLSAIMNFTCYIHHVSMAIMDETIDHLLVCCVFTRQVWFRLLQSVGFLTLAPQPDDTSFDVWWEKASVRVSGQVRNGLNSIIILGVWLVWNHRNRWVWWRSTWLECSLQCDQRGASSMELSQGLRNFLSPRPRALTRAVGSLV